MSDLVVRVDLQQMWQNDLQVLLYELLRLYVHGAEQSGPETGASRD